MSLMICCTSRPMRGDAADGAHGRALGQRDGALGDIGRVIADALDVAGDLEGGHDLAQVLRHRLAQRQHADRLVADLALELVDARIALHDPRRTLGIARHQRFDGGLQLRLGQAAHLGHQLAQLLQLIIETFDRCVRSTCQTPKTPAAAATAQVDPRPATGADDNYYGFMTVLVLDLGTTDPWLFAPMTLFGGGGAAGRMGR